MYILIILYIFFKLKCTVSLNKLKNSINKIFLYNFRNQEHSIKASISQLIWVKEIIIYNKVSSDNAVEICR